MRSLLGVIEQSFKSGKRQSLHATVVNNICVGLLAGLKVRNISCRSVVFLLFNLLLLLHLNPVDFVFRLCFLSVLSRWGLRY